MILTGSVFYGWWDIRFLALLFFTAFVDYFVARAIENSGDEKKRKRLLLVSLLSNLSVLGFFKYFNFFAGSFVQAAETLGFHPDFVTLKIVLPVGISFYTFQALSYTIDVYRKQIAAVKQPDVYLAYITFFPQLVAGPIARSTQLIPQFQRVIPFSEPFAVSGLRLMLWGFFKKCVIADNVSVIADQLFSGTTDVTAGAVFIGTLAFGIQVYCDFSGYSDIARGCARLFGIDLAVNFRFPYFATSITDFWRRWHVSLSRWFNDYVYMPYVLQRREQGLRAMISGIILTFSISGLWHGAAWTFVAFGFVHGLAVAFELISKKWRKSLSGKIPAWIYFSLGALCTHAVILFGWILFRSESFGAVAAYVSALFSSGSTGAGVSSLLTGNWNSWLFLCGMIILILFLFTVEFLQSREFHFSFLRFRLARWSAYTFIIFILLLFGVFRQPPSFIYFQF